MIFLNYYMYIYTHQFIHSLIIKIITCMHASKNPSACILMIEVLSWRDRKQHTRHARPLIELIKKIPRQLIYVELSSIPMHGTPPTYTSILHVSNVSLAWFHLLIMACHVLLAIYVIAPPSWKLRTHARVYTFLICMHARIQNNSTIPVGLKIELTC